MQQAAARPAQPPAGGVEERVVPVDPVVRHLRDELGARVGSTSAMGDEDIVMTIDPEGFIDGLEADASVFGWEHSEQGEWVGRVEGGAPPDGS